MFPFQPENWRIIDGAGSSVGAGGSPGMRHGAAILAIRFLPDETSVVVAGGGYLAGADSKIRVFDSIEERELLILEGHAHGIYNLAVDKYSGLVASASHDYSVILWNLEKRDCLVICGADDEQKIRGHVRFAGGGKLLVVGDIEYSVHEVSSVRVIDLTTGGDIYWQDLPEHHTVSALSIDEAGTRLFYSFNHYYGAERETLRCIDLTSGALLWDMDLRADVISDLHLVEAENMLAANIMLAGGEHSGIYLINAEDGELMARHTVKGSYTAVTALSSDQRMLACLADSSMQLTLHSTHDLSMLSPPMSLARGQELATAVPDDGRLDASPPADERSGAGEKSGERFDEQSASAKDTPTALEFFPDGKALLVATTDRTLKRVDIPPYAHA